MLLVRLDCAHAHALMPMPMLVCMRDGLHRVARNECSVKMIFIFNIFFVFFQEKKNQKRKKIFEKNKNM